MGLRLRKKGCSVWETKLNILEVEEIMQMRIWDARNQTKLELGHDSFFFPRSQFLLAV